MDEMNKDICFMFNEREGCTGRINMNICGEACPFRKTEEEQMRAEKKIVARFNKINYIGTYKSRIDGQILYANDGVKKKVYLEV